MTTDADKPNVLTRQGIETMQIATSIQPQTTRRPWRPIILTIACLLSFCVGYWASVQRHKDRVFDEGRRQLEECLSVCISSGVFVVNDKRLAELTSDQAGDEGDSTNPP